jgi:hypothetical protein
MLMLSPSGIACLSESTAGWMSRSAVVLMTGPRRGGDTLSSMKENARSVNPASFEPKHSGSSRPLERLKDIGHFTL